MAFQSMLLKILGIGHAKHNRLYPFDTIIAL